VGTTITISKDALMMLLVLPGISFGLGILSMWPGFGSGRRCVERSDQPTESVESAVPTAVGHRTLGPCPE
jgi:hypothetical protein